MCNGNDAALANNRLADDGRPFGGSQRDRQRLQRVAQFGVGNVAQRCAGFGCDGFTGTLGDSGSLSRHVAVAQRDAVNGTYRGASESRKDGQAAGY